MNAPEHIEMQLDLQAMELLVVTALANLGQCVLAGDRDAARELGDMLIAMPNAEIHGRLGLEKLEASLKLAKAMTSPPEEA